MLILTMKCDSCPTVALDIESAGPLTADEAARRLIKRMDAQGWNVTLLKTTCPGCGKKGKNHANRPTV